jgi:hypothetical protein
VHPAAATTYTLTSLADGNCSGTVAGSATVTVNTASTAFTTLAASEASICPGTSSTLHAAGGIAGTAAETRWYASQDGSSLLATGETLTVHPSTTTTYYVRREGTCGMTDFQALTVTVVPVATQQPIAGMASQAVNQQSTTYAIPGTGVTDFTWTLSGGTIVAGQGTEAVQISWDNTPGFYQLTVTYGSGLPCSQKTSTRTIAVYDTGAGFVTGGGWIHSPRNAAFPYMQAAGKAQFSLTAKYKKGDLVEGNTSFELKVGKLDFRSSTHEKMRLVIAGNTANYTGTGTINGAGQYGFLLAAVDGDLQGRKAPDKLRMQIWELATGTRVYDNQAGADQGSEAREAINGGAITIHEGKDKKAVAESLVNTTADSTQFTAYPNPFQDKAAILFSFDQDENYSIDVFDVQGHLLKHLSSGTAYAGELVQAEWQPATAIKGIFIVRITTDKNTARYLRLIRN